MADAGWKRFVPEAAGCADGCPCGTIGRMVRFALLLAALAAPALADTAEDAWVILNLDAAARYAGEVDSCQPGFSSDLPPAGEALTGALRCTFRAMEALHGPAAAAEEVARVRDGGRTPVAFLLGLAVPEAEDARLAEMEDACLLFEAALASPMMTALTDRVGGRCGGVW